MYFTQVVLVYYFLLQYADERDQRQQNQITACLMEQEEKALLDYTHRVAINWRTMMTHYNAG